MKKGKLIGLCGLSFGLVLGLSTFFNAGGKVVEANALTLGDGSYYVYYVTGSGEETHDCVYAWKETAGGDVIAHAWPGQWIPTVSTDITGVINFEVGYKKIYKITFDEVPDYFILNNGGNGAQTGNLEFVNGNAYWWSDDLDGDAAAGKAIDFLIKVENARNSASSFEGHNYSVCGVDSQTAADLYSEYANLSPDVKDYVNRSSTKTYKGKNDSGQYDWDEGSIGFYDIMQEFEAIARNDGKLSLVRNGYAFENEGLVNQSDAFVIGATICCVLVSAGGLLFLKKRKANN